MHFFTDPRNIAAARRHRHISDLGGDARCVVFSVGVTLILRTTRRESIPGDLDAASCGVQSSAKQGLHPPSICSIVLFVFIHQSKWMNSYSEGACVPQGCGTQAPMDGFTACRSQSMSSSAFPIRLMTIPTNRAVTIFL